MKSFQIPSSTAVFAHHIMVTIVPFIVKQVWKIDTSYSTAKYGYNVEVFHLHKIQEVRVTLQIYYPSVKFNDR